MIFWPEAATTSAQGVIFRPPNVNVMPHVTGKQRYGGASSRWAQFDFGGVMPAAALPSLTAGSKGLALTAALNSAIVRPSVCASIPAFCASSAQLVASTREVPGSVYGLFSRDATFLSNVLNAFCRGCRLISCPC